MTEIYLIRHAQAEGNLYRMMQGHWDGDVTDMGRRQIEALAQRLKDERIDALYSSDLYRTRLTACAVTKYHDIPIHTDKRLREINVGPWGRDLRRCNRQSLSLPGGDCPGAPRTAGGRCESRSHHPLPVVKNKRDQPQGHGKSPHLPQHRHIQAPLRGRAFYGGIYE